MMCVVISENRITLAVSVLNPAEAAHHYEMKPPTGTG